MSSHLPDFEVLKRMAETNPKGLEALRQKLIADVLAGASADQRRRLEGLQFRIDVERRRAANPLAATIKLSAMMRDSLLRLQHAVNNPESLRAVPAHTAAVLAFPQRGIRTATQDGVVRR